jgi:hypothetical protein
MFANMKTSCIFVLQFYHNEKRTVMTTAQRTEILKLQATLTKIDCKIPVFFNITLFTKMGLVKEHGKTHDNKTNWVLTEKGKMYLNVQL